MVLSTSDRRRRLWLSCKRVCETRFGPTEGISPMTTFLYTHRACLEHDPGRHHPESPARLRAVLEALDHPEFAGLHRREAPESARADLLRVHPPRHIDRILSAVPKSGHVGID